MKVLITGAGSYIGKNVERHLIEEGITVDTLDMLKESWVDYDFSPYDTVYHVAGIAHDLGGTANDKMYMDVNFKMSLECAAKAKKAGVKHFVFMSSLLVYNGITTNMITKDTEPKTKTVYAESKLLADNAIRALADESFIVAVMRPPMIFGPNCKGNFPRLVHLADTMKIFPNYKNQRSMCYIENFCSAVVYVIKNRLGGIFFPQNREYFCTADIVRTAAELKGKKVRFTKLFNWLIKPFSKVSALVSKMFSDYVIDKDLSKPLEEVMKVDNKTSLKESIILKKQ